MLTLFGCDTKIDCMLQFMTSTNMPAPMRYYYVIDTAKQIVCFGRGCTSHCSSPAKSALVELGPNRTLPAQLHLLSPQCRGSYRDCAFCAQSWEAGSCRRQRTFLVCTSSDPSSAGKCSDDECCQDGIG